MLDFKADGSVLGVVTWLECVEGIDESSESSERTDMDEA